MTRRTVSLTDALYDYLVEVSVRESDVLARLREETGRLPNANMQIGPGGPVGLNTLAVAIGENEETLMDVYEPYLIQSGYLQRTTRGRVATAWAYEHLRRPPPKDRRDVEGQAGFFEPE
jgi:hypothetical protein